MRRLAHITCDDTFTMPIKGIINLLDLRRLRWLHSAVFRGAGLLFIPLQDKIPESMRGPSANLLTFLHGFTAFRFIIIRDKAAESLPCSLQS